MRSLVDTKMIAARERVRVRKRSVTEQIEFGDFQTPVELASQCCQVVLDRLGHFETVVEPTCGEGAFIGAAARTLRPSLLVAYEIHRPYVEVARRQIASSDGCQFQVNREDFFALDWTAERKKFAGRVLYLGNPPWVTNSALGAIASKNSPRKSNVEGLRGIEAMTGRSNFDISESVLQTLLEAMRPDRDALAMLVKKATARKVLKFAWAKEISFSHASLYQIDAKQSFGVSVEACLLLLQRSTQTTDAAQVCYRSPSLSEPATEIALGWSDRRLVSNPLEAAATRHLQGDSSTPWRSGVKHDLSRVLELTERDGLLFTQDGQRVDVEMDHIYPLAKGSDVANLRTDCPNRRMLVPQRAMNESTQAMSGVLPKTYRYLESHSDAFAARKSSIYRNRDRFAVFGIGGYTFTPWKVAICGLYKRLTFAVFGPLDGRPVVFDDTTYCLPLDNEPQARHLQRLLESDVACRFFNARVFWDAKRPITAELLRSLDLAAVAGEIGCEDEFQLLFGDRVGESLSATIR